MTYLVFFNNKKKQFLDALLSFYPNTAIVRGIYNPDFTSALLVFFGRKLAINVLFFQVMFRRTMRN